MTSDNAWVSHAHFSDVLNSLVAELGEESGKLIKEGTSKLSEGQRAELAELMKEATKEPLLEILRLCGRLELRASEAERKSNEIGEKLVALELKVSGMEPYRE